MGVIQMSKGNLPPVSSHLLSEPVIVCRLATGYSGRTLQGELATLYASTMDYIRQDIEKVIPAF